MTDQGDNARVVADGMVKKYIDSLVWSEETPQETRALVIGNLHGIGVLVAQVLREMQRGMAERLVEESMDRADPLWRVREGSMTALISEMARGIDRQHLGLLTGEPDVTVSRQRLWVTETLATIAGVYLRNLVNPLVNDARRAELAAEYAGLWLKELQAAVLRYETIGEGNDV